MTCENVQGLSNKLRSLAESMLEIDSCYWDLIQKFDFLDESKPSWEMSPSQQKDFLIDSLIIIQKMHTDFLFLKNVVDIQWGNLNLENEYFDLKPSIFYTLDCIMSLKKDCQLDVNYTDPTLPHLV